MLRIERKGKVFEIKALAIADSYRMTCPVVRVTKMGEGEAEVGKELKEVYVSVGVMANLLVELAEVEEVMPTLEDHQQVSMGVDAKWKTRQRLINSPRKEVEKLIRDVDHTICGPQCEELPMPDCIRALNEEFAAIFPAVIPGGCLLRGPRITGSTWCRIIRYPDRSCTGCRRRRIRSCRSS